MSASLGKTDTETTNLIEDNVFLRGLATRYFLNTPISFETWDDLELTYQFRKTEPSPEHSNTIRWNENIGAAAQNVFSQIEAISNLRFTEVNENADIDFWLYFENENKNEQQTTNMNNLKISNEPSATPISGFSFLSTES